jgi:hypothetical protein
MNNPATPAFHPIVQTIRESLLELSTKSNLEPSDRLNLSHLIQQYKTLGGDDVDLLLAVSQSFSVVDKSVTVYEVHLKEEGTCDGDILHPPVLFLNKTNAIKYARSLHWGVDLPELKDYSKKYRYPYDDGWWSALNIFEGPNGPEDGPLWQMNMTDGCGEGLQSCELKKRETNYKSGGENGLHKGFVYDSTTFWHKVQDPPTAGAEIGGL